MEREINTPSQSWETTTTSTAASVGVLHVLVVDDDSTCLKVVAAVLKTWKYEVVTAKHPSDALSTLRVKRGLFDLVVTDIHMPGMNGFELQKQVEEEFKLPVIMMSADDREGVMLKGLAGGAVFFIVKPVKVEELKNIWQYAITIKKSKSIDMEKSRSSQEPPIFEKQPITEDIDSMASSINEEKRNRRECKRKASKRGSSALGEDEKSESMAKKTKVVWTNALHNRFLEAVRKIGLEKAVPKKILELMNVSGLTRENIASHLQKYRMFLRRVSDASNSIEQQYLRTSFQQGLAGNLPIVNAPLLNSATRFHDQEISPPFGNALSHSMSNQTTNSPNANTNPNNRAIQTIMSLLPPAGGTNPMQMHQPQLSRALLGHVNSTILGLRDASSIHGIETIRSLKNPNSITKSEDISSNNYVGIRMTSNGELIGPSHSRALRDGEKCIDGCGYGLMSMVHNGSTTNPYLVQEMPFPRVGSESSSQPSTRLQMLRQNIVGNEGKENNHVLGLMHGSSSFVHQQFNVGGDLGDVLPKQINDHYRPIGGKDGEEVWNHAFPSSYFVEENHPRNELLPLELQGEFGASSYQFDEHFESLDQYLNQGAGEEELMNLVFGTSLYGGDNYLGN